MFKYENGPGLIVASFSKPEVVIEIESHENGIFRFRVGGINKGVDPVEQIASALAQWRKETGAKIISIAGFEHNETPSLIVIAETREKILATPISDLNLSLASKKHMDRNGIQTIGDLIAFSSLQLLNSHLGQNFSPKHLKEIEYKLAERHGLHLREVTPEDNEAERP